MFSQMKELRNFNIYLINENTLAIDQTFNCYNRSDIMDVLAPRIGRLDGNI